ncbi:mitochondrial carrier [Aspergillus sclerotiicarbonarius CBS 121057]|uniref:Mitochondrial carrier n=1 Tax=Aspergillus sclerotiicarbonarius (strain CBS 121057 / IBT 28362) TaxID=1448318 RepID=A0A319DZN5_ASPSB|nr:mitochondrial carrier [Aspergillus sclerotiicarbonarius CBS 121057]
MYSVIMSTTDIWISGAFAVVVVDLLVYPFDTLKTRIQSPNYTQTYKNPHTGALNRGLLFRGLYQGVGSVVLATIPASGAFFTTYEALKHTLHNLPSSSKSNIPSPIIHSISSCTAEAISCLIITPAEVIKQNAQDKNLPFTGLNWPVFEFLRTSLSDTIITRRRRRRRRRRDGVENGDYPTTTSTSTTPGSGRGDRNRDGDKDKDTISKTEHVLITGTSAATAGTFSSVVTTPVDVVKTRMMLGATSSPHPPFSHSSSTSATSATSGDKTGEGKQSPSAWAMGKKVVREEGVRGLFKGGVIRSVWTAVSFGIYLCMYEGGRGVLEGRRRERRESV